MTFMSKQWTWYQCSNNISKWMAFVFIPYEPMKNKFGTTIIVKSWPIIFVMKVINILVYPFFFSPFIFSLLIHKIIYIYTLVLMKTTSQIYKFHGFIPNLCEICYFISSYCFNTNIMHYFKTEVVCMIFVCKQHTHTHTYNICV